MKTNIKCGIAVIVYAVVVLASLPAQTLSQNVRNAFSKAGLNPERDLKVLPDFSPVATTNAAGKVSLANYRGKIVFLNMWATWCGPCRAEMPSMEKVYQRYKNRGLEILAVNLREDRPKVETFMKQNGLSFPALFDSDGAIGGKYGIRAIPTSYILDKQGRVILRLVGSINWDRPEIYEAFDALFSE